MIGDSTDSTDSSVTLSSQSTIGAEMEEEEEHTILTVEEVPDSTMENYEAEESDTSSQMVIRMELEKKFLHKQVIESTYD